MPTFPKEMRARGALLTGWLVVMLLTNIWSVYRYTAIIQGWLSHADPKWERLGPPFVALIVLSIVNIIALGLLWQWRIIGLYVFVGISLIAFVIKLFLNIPVTTALIGLAGMIVLYALINPKRVMFD